MVSLYKNINICLVDIRVLKSLYGRYIYRNNMFKRCLWLYDDNFFLYVLIKI